jgi:hypothetical protein
MSGRFPIVLMMTSLLAACSHAGAITNISTDYNRAMADVRNQQLLLNIMRSSAREPLQFSAMGEVAATVHRSIGVDTMLNNLIVGGAAAVNHTVSLEARNEPVIKIAPLSDKEFTSGILQPTSPETLKQFLDLGWDPEFMLPLIVAGYRCPGGTFQPNSGKGATGEGVRRALVSAAASMHFAERATPGEPVKLVVSDEKALEMIRSGLAGGYQVKSVQPASQGGLSEVRLTGPAKSELVVMLKLCEDTSAVGTKSLELQTTTMEFDNEAADNGVESTDKTTSDEPKPGYMKLRSIEGIIYFLGESYRPCFLNPGTPKDCSLSYSKDGANRYLFRLSRGGAGAGNAAIETEFYGTRYWVSRLDPDDVDRTVKTFSFLDQLFALQVEPGAISTTPTVLTIGGR